MLELTHVAASQFQMWAVFVIILSALALYVMEKVPMEVTSFGVICALLLFFHIFPLPGDDGINRLSPAHILKGAANPALISVLALLVMGQGMVRTGMLDRGARLVMGISGKRSWVSITLVLMVILLTSAFLNNTPVVVIFIPIMQAMAARFGFSVSKVMIPLSFAAILGGMTTLIGSSTNLLVNSSLIQMSLQPFGFFDFLLPGMVMAGVGLVYLLVVAPRLLPDRASLVDTLFEGGGKQFIAQIAVGKNSELIDKGATGGHFASLPDMTVRMVQRGEEGILPPFEEYRACDGDVLVVAATRKALTEALSQDPGLLDPDLQDGRIPDEDQRWQEGEKMLAEVMVAPASRLIGQTLPQIGFRYKTHCIVLGVQRRSRMIRARLTDIRLRAGDVLLVQGQSEDISALKVNGDVVLIEWSTEELPTLDHAKRASSIFLLTIGLAASGVVPIVIAALSGAAAMVGLGVLNVRQASRAIDPLIVSTIVAALALGAAMQETGGADFLAHVLVSALAGTSPAVVLSLFFLIVAIFTNLISNNAVAVLFTPIAVDLALAMEISPQVFAVAVIFAANCSFASPLGYQTNLLVMAPGHYRFTDYARVGVPLVIILWLTFSLFAPWYYGI